MRLTWKREPRETGLSAIGAPPRGSKLHDGNITYASTSCSRDNKMNIKGWYWVAGWDSNVPYMNTCNNLCKTEDEAKKAARDYVNGYVKEGKKS